MQNNLFFLKLYVEAMLNKLNSVKSQKGVTIIEYALIGALVAAVIVAAINILGPGINTAFTNIADTLTGAGAGAGD
jgi:pilus assembly protein Flp/PilA